MKRALHGFCLSIAREGEKHNIHCNSIAPLAASRITETVLPKEILQKLTPSYIAPFVGYLCTEECKENGSLFELGGGFIAKLRVQRAQGLLLKTNDNTFSVEAVAQSIHKARDFSSNSEYPSSMLDVDWINLLERSQKLPPNPVISPNLNFKDQIVLITGAGGGLGKAYAILFAKYHATVIVNDLNAEAAQKVVHIIMENGGKAFVEAGSVNNGQKIVENIIKNHGRIDVLINNAGILKDKSFLKMNDNEWQAVIDVHLKGAYIMCKAVWPVMVQQKYGRIVNTSSAVGLYGNFGQTNYSSAKAGIIALSNTLALEGKKFNIIVNTIAPNAGTSMTATILSKDIVDILKPEYVAPFVGYLCHRVNNESGLIFEVGSGWFSEVRWERSQGFKFQKKFTIDEVAAVFAQICSFNNINEHPNTPEESFNACLSERQNDKKLEECPTYNYTFKDVILYNIGIGFGAKDLSFVYENADLRAFPTFLVLPAFNCMMNLDINNYIKDFSPINLLHGEQFLEIHGELNAQNGSLLTNYEIVECIYKGSGTVLTARMETRDAKTKQLLAVNYSTTFNRKCSPKKEIKKSLADTNADIRVDLSVFNREPDFSFKELVNSDQASIYRLSGDYNPLHMY